MLFRSQSVPNATSSPSVDQEVSSVSHPMPFRFRFDPPSDTASVDAFIKAYPNLPGYHMRSTWDRLTAVSTYGPPGSEEDDEPDSGWDFSGLDNPSAMRDFMTACDYRLSDCSDSSHSLGDGLPPPVVMSIQPPCFAKPIARSKTAG